MLKWLFELALFKVEKTPMKKLTQTTKKKNSLCIFMISHYLFSNPWSIVFWYSLSLTR